MAAIKRIILNKWDTSPQGCKISCIKFVQKVIQVQTQGEISDPRVSIFEVPTCLSFGESAKFHGWIQRPEKNETSLAVVPRNHALLVLPNIEAETSGLLDRLLNVFYENSRCATSILCSPTILQNNNLTIIYSDALLVNATLNCVAVLIRTRPSTANKILETILNFNPLKEPYPPITPIVRVNIKSMERTVRTLLVNVLKRYAW